MADETDQDHSKRDDVRLRLVSSTHEITPRYRSIHKTTGEPVTGLDPRDYPLNAVCVECGNRITCRNYIADWIHVGV